MLACLRVLDTQESVESEEAEALVRRDRNASFEPLLISKHQGEKRRVTLTTQSQTVLEDTCSRFWFSLRPSGMGLVRARYQH